MLSQSIRRVLRYSSAALQIRQFLLAQGSAQFIARWTAAGLGNLPGVILTALGLGVVEQYSGFVLGAQFQQATVVSLLLIILVLRTVLLRRHRLALQ